MRVLCLLIGVTLILPPRVNADSGPPPEKPPAPLNPVEQRIVDELDRMRPELVGINQDIWNYAELGLEEHRSSARLIEVLEKNGFRVTKGVADMPTAFVAEYGSGGPVVGILAEYDALPDLSQQVTPDKRPVAERTTGHGCGHSALGTAAVGAAIALRKAMETEGVRGTIRVYGTPAEETVIGKVYMTLAGCFDDLDVCLHWHPDTKNRVRYERTKAIISVKFTFTGLPAHSSASPHKGRSALDAVELTNIGVNYMREHIEETSRIHYVITQGGGAPNVVPASAQVWYFIRANTHEMAEYQFEWVKDIAESAAKMTRTKLAIAIDTDCHEVIPNLPLSKLLDKHFQRIGPPKFTAADVEFARGLQEPLRADFGLTDKKHLHDELERLPSEPYPADGGSTDVGDVSWHVPTSGLGTACFAAGSPGHSWQNVAAIGSPIGHQGMMTAAKVLAISAADLLQNPELVEAAKKDFQERMSQRKYTTKIPPGQKAPKAIR
ncbi:MAG: amidohydrolase [Planctomycetota bacterium]